jgi:hypothetical protein
MTMANSAALLGPMCWLDLRPGVERVARRGEDRMPVAFLFEGPDITGGSGRPRSGPGPTSDARSDGWHAASEHAR